MTSSATVWATWSSRSSRTTASPSGGGIPVRWGATISVEAATAFTAIDAAAAIVRRAGSDVFLPDWPVVRAEAIREDVLDEDLARPSA